MNQWEVFYDVIQPEANSWSENFFSFRPMYSPTSGYPIGNTEQLVYVPYWSPRPFFFVFVCVRSEEIMGLIIRGGRSEFEGLNSVGTSAWWVHD